MRDNGDFKEQVKSKYGVDNVYSYSQIKTFEDDPYEYYLKYVIKQEPDIDVDNIYGVLGGCVHDILESFYTNELSRADCQNQFETKFKQIMIDPKVSKFADDEQYNINIATKYQLDIVNYFKRVTKMEGKVFCELPIDVLLEDDKSKAVFIGYIDFLNFDKDGNANIIDYKTSTKYKDSQIDSYSQQLMLYAYAVHKKYGIPYENINASWNFLKYATLVSKVDMSEEVIERCKLTNRIDDDYLVTDCIITIKVNEDTINDFIETMLVKVREIDNKVTQYNITHNDDVFSYEMTEDKLFRVTNFCKYSKNVHKPLREYLQKIHKNIV